MKTEHIHQVIGCLFVSGNEALAKKLADELKLTKRSIKEDEPAFTYDELAKDMWFDIIGKAKKYYNISFDLENNDPAKDEKAKIITISRPSEDKIQSGKTPMKDEFKVRCQLWFAGGDWEQPCMYFKCQLIKNTFYGLGSIKTYLGDLGEYRSSHWVIIPPKDAGNTHLIERKNGGWTAITDEDLTGGEKTPELEPNKAWKWLKEHFMKMVNDHIAGKNKKESKEASETKGSTSTNPKL